MLKVLSKEPSALSHCRSIRRVLMTFNEQFQFNTSQCAPVSKPVPNHRLPTNPQNAVILHDPPISFARWDHSSNSQTSQICGVRSQTAAILSGNNDL
jgi:hypothetical protein